MTFKEILKKMWNFSNKPLPGSPTNEKQLKKLRPGLDFNIDEDKQGISINFQASCDFVRSDIKEIRICEKNQQIDDFKLPCEAALKFDSKNTLVGIDVKGDVLPEIYKLNDKQLYKKASRFHKVLLIIIVVYIFYYLFSQMFK